MKRFLKRVPNHLRRRLHLPVKRLRQQYEREPRFDKIKTAASFVTFFNQTEGLINFEETMLLYRLAQSIRSGCIVEVGSYRGRSTVALGRGSLDGYGVPVYAIEPHREFYGVYNGAYGPPDRGAFYQAMLRTSCFHLVHLINLSSEVVAPNWQDPIALLWIDGDHAYEGVKRDVDCWLPYLMPDALVAFDDSLDAALGPHKLIQELQATGRFKTVQQKGKVTVLQYL